MDDCILIVSEDSDNSIVEVEVPKKPPPPLIEIEDEEIVLNISQADDKSLSAKEFIDHDKELSNMSKKETSQCLNSPNHWTLDMIKFYNDGWGNEEQFIVEKIQEKMDKTPSLWEISKKDFLNMHNRLRRSNIKCWNCNQRGHHFSMCPDPPYVPKCHMCGLEGHVEYSCPNSKCLNCGNYCRKYVTCCQKCRHETNEMCSRCSIIGHNFINCPDHWRLFHMSTTSTSVVIPTTNIYKSNKDIWCCNCGKRGHYQYQCKQRKDFSGFTDTLPFVVSYEKAFNNSQIQFKPQSKPQFLPYCTPELNGFKKEKSKGNRKHKDKLEKILQFNPLNKVIKKDKAFFKNKFKRFKKFKKNRRKKKEHKGPWNIITL